MTTWNITTNASRIIAFNGKTYRVSNYHGDFRAEVRIEPKTVGVMRNTAAAHYRILRKPSPALRAAAAAAGIIGR